MQEGEIVVSSGEELGAGSILSGTYKILRTLGRGGFGITYEAEDLSQHERVAIKEFFPDFCAVRHPDGRLVPKPGRDEEFAKHRESFRLEAEALSRFDHPNIVHVLARFDGNSTSYFVMEFIAGEPLDRFCHGAGPLQTEAVMLIAENVVEAVKTIHDQGLLHRDIKPANIILADLRLARPTRLPQLPHEVLMRFGKPVVLDFGAVREAGAEGRTMTGIVTHGFGAPEQSVERGHQDVRTDLYGIGATLYFCLAGQVPSSAVDRQHQDLLVPAQQRFAGRAPASFLRAIDRAMQLRPEYRPKDVRTFRGELFADFKIQGWSLPASTYSAPGPGIYAGGSNSQTPGPGLERPDADSAPAQRRSSAVGAVVVIFLAVAAVAGGGYLWLFGPGSATGVRADSNIEFLLRRIEAAQSTYNEISTLSTTRNEFAIAPGMRNEVRNVDRRISELRRQAQSDFQSGHELFAALTNFARENQAEFQSMATRMESSARAEGRTNTVRRLTKLRQLVMTSSQSGTIDEAAFSSFWNQEVELAQ